MTEGQSKWHKGQPVDWEGIEPYTIVRPVGEAGNIHISKTGRYHVYWHREGPDGKVMLIHHGGPSGFGTLAAVMHQHERVILSYTGLTIQLPLEQVGEVPEEEQKAGIPASGLTFPELIKDMKTLELPGEQQILGNWIKTLQNVNRDLPQVTTHGQLSEIREDLDKLRKDLSRKKNPYKKGAGISLAKGLAGSKGQLLAGANEAQTELLQRVQQTVSIVVGTMKRYNELERLQIHWNRTVEGSLNMAGQLLNTLQSPDFIDSERINRMVASHILNKDLSIEVRLRQLEGEPYFSRAQGIIDSLAPLRRHWEERNLQKMIQVLTGQAKELEVWKRRVREEHTGINFGKYNLS